MSGVVKALSISKTKGEKKHNVESAIFKADFGIVGDAHAGSNRQVSLLAFEEIEKMLEKGASVKPGDFAENITTEGFNLETLKVGGILNIGKEVRLKISQIGKECKAPCRIYKQFGDCVMPKAGIFAKVLKGGEVKIKDRIKTDD